MKKDETYESLEEVLNNIPDNYRIMEETIDLEIQKAYYEFSMQINQEHDTDNTEHLINMLHSPEQTVDELKTVLIKLAMLDSVAAYRAIESYQQNALPELKEWAVLALQQSRMLLQSSLSGEQQVFISTGLGGKADKLRYFLIFPFHKEIFPSELQVKTLRAELDFFTKQYNGLIENFQLHQQYSTATLLFPLRANLPAFVQDLITECNQIGNFLSNNVMITNMKIFSPKEINELLFNEHNT